MPKFTLCGREEARASQGGPEWHPATRKESCKAQEAGWTNKYEGRHLEGIEGGHFLLPFSGSENEDQRNGSPDDLFIHPSTRLFSPN
jgi:hypothetical protein